MPKTKDTSLSNAELGRLLRSLRQRKRKTLTEVAKAANISVPYLWQLEQGKSSPSGAIIRDLATSLGVAINYLLGEKINLTYDPNPDINPTAYRWHKILSDEKIPTEIRNAWEQVLNSQADICTQYFFEDKEHEITLKLDGKPLAERVATYPKAIG